MTIRWGIIGCGSVTEVKSGPGFQKVSGSELIAVMRRTSHCAEDYAKRHSISRWYDNADALIHDPEVTAIYIATPPGSHLEYALKAREAGKPAYVEKPMARNYDECRQIVESFGSAGLRLFVAYYRRALPRFLKAKEIVVEGFLTFGPFSNVPAVFRVSEGRLACIVTVKSSNKDTKDKVFETDTIPVKFSNKKADLESNECRGPLLDAQAFGRIHRLIGRLSCRRIVSFFAPHDTGVMPRLGNPTQRAAVLEEVRGVGI